MIVWIASCVQKWNLVSKLSFEVDSEGKNRSIFAYTKEHKKTVNLVVRASNKYPN